MNMQNLMAQATKLQKEITKKKEEIDNTDFTGKSEWVEITINGKKEIKEINIKYNETITSDDKEMLEDMIKIAFQDATKKVDKEIENKMGAYGSAMNGLF